MYGATGKPAGWRFALGGRPGAAQRPRASRLWGRCRGIAGEVSLDDGVASGNVTTVTGLTLPSGRRCYEHPWPSGWGSSRQRGGQGAFIRCQRMLCPHSGRNFPPSRGEPARARGRWHNILWIKGITSQLAAATMAAPVQPPARRAGQPTRKMR
jgi:hypothetical protein